MLRYYSSLHWHEDLPIMLALVLLKEPAVKNISNGTASRVLGADALRHHYRVIKLYGMVQLGLGFRGGLLPPLKLRAS